MSKLLLLLVTLLLGTCAHPTTQVPSVSTASSTEPFSFKGTYDANEIYQKKGIYYINSFTKGGGYVQYGKFVDYYPVVTPHKMQAPLTFLSVENPLPMALALRLVLAEAILSTVARMGPGCMSHLRSQR